MNIDSFVHYKMGITHIDDEHWTIIDSMNKINETIKRRDVDNIGKNVYDLNILLTQHLVYENSMMEEIDFPYVVHHQSEHKIIVSELERLCDSKTFHCEQVVLTLKDLVVKHIDHSDFQYQKYYKKWLSERMASS